MLWFALGFLFGAFVAFWFGFFLAAMCNVAANEAAAPFDPTDEQRRKLLDYDNEKPFDPPTTWGK
jgi:hypothetical protein